MDPTAEGRDKDEIRIPDTKLRVAKVTPGPGPGAGAGGDDDETAAAAPSTEAVIAALNTSLLPLRCGHSDTEAALYLDTRSAAVYGGVGGYSAIRPGLVGLTPGQFREIRCGS